MSDTPTTRLVVVIDGIEHVLELNTHTLAKAVLSSLPSLPSLPSRRLPERPAEYVNRQYVVGSEETAADGSTFPTLHIYSVDI